MLREVRLAQSIRKAERRFADDPDVDAARLVILDGIRLLFADTDYARTDGKGMCD